MAIPLRPNKQFLYTFITLFLIILCKSLVLTDRNRYYHISALCMRERIHPMHKKIDGAVITSSSENNLDCTITFQTDTILQRFMLRFEKLALDCDDHLFIYDGAHAIGNHKIDLSCRSTRTEVGTIFTQGSFLTLKYTTDPYSHPDNGFRVVITAFKEAPVNCKEQKCLNSFCISKDLSCDGINHCGDNSDETSHAYCTELEPPNGLILGLDPNTFITLIIIIFIICSLCVVSVAICLCRRERLIQHQQQRIALHQQSSQPVLAHPMLAHPQTYSSGGQQRFATLPLERNRDKPPPYPGNLYSPAAGNAHSQVVSEVVFANK